MLWCPTDRTDVSLVSTLSDQSWYPSYSFSYTFSGWGSSHSCSDLRVRYNQVNLYRKVYGSYEDASSYLSFDTITRTITGLTTPAISDEFLIRIEGVANDGKCTQSEFTISNPCRYNALSKSGNGLADQLYSLGDFSYTVYPSSFLSTTVGTGTCPLSYSYYIWSDT